MLWIKAKRLTHRVIERACTVQPVGELPVKLVQERLQTLTPPRMRGVVLNAAIIVNLYGVKLGKLCILMWHSKSRANVSLHESSDDAWSRAS